MPANAKSSSRKKKKASKAGRRRRRRPHISRKNDTALHRNYGKMAETSQDYALKSNRKSRITAALMSPGARGLCAAAIAASLMAAAAPLSAQQAVPIPKPAPKGRDGMQMSDTTRAPVTTGPTRSAAPEPVIPDPHRNVPA